MCRTVLIVVNTELQETLLCVGQFIIIVNTELQFAMCRTVLYHCKYRVTRNIAILLCVGQFFIVVNTELQETLLCGLV